MPHPGTWRESTATEQGSRGQEGHCPSFANPKPLLRGPSLYSEIEPAVSDCSQNGIHRTSASIQREKGAHIWLQARSVLRDEVILAPSLMHPRLNTPTTPSKGSGALPKKPGCLSLIMSYVWAEVVCRVSLLPHPATWLLLSTLGYPAAHFWQDPSHDSVIFKLH